MAILKDILKIIIKWSGSSVSSLVVIAGIISIILYALSKEIILLFIGVLFVLAGLIGAIAITEIINNQQKSRW